MLALKQYVAGRNVTVVLVDDLTVEPGARDGHLHSIAHGVITLKRQTLEFGASRRQIQVQKMRGIDFTAGFHDVVISRGGLKVFPGLIASEHHTPFIGESLSSGVTKLDALLGGGP